MTDYQWLGPIVLILSPIGFAVLLGWMARGVWDGFRRRRIVAKYAAPLRPVQADRDRSDEPTGV